MTKAQAEKSKDASGTGARPKQDSDSAAKARGRITPDDSNEAEDPGANKSESEPE